MINELTHVNHHHTFLSQDRHRRKLKQAEEAHDIAETLRINEGLLLRGQLARDEANAKGDKSTHKHMYQHTPHRMLP